MRDSQRTKLYSAEDGVEWGQAFASVEATQAFVDKIVQSEYWDRFDHAPRVLIVRDGRGRRHACMRRSYYGGEICMPKWSRSPLIVLHELAHALGSESEAFHGSEFAKRYSNLVGYYMSLDSKAELISAFDHHGVKY